MKMYSELSEWWPLISPVEHYRDEARFFGNVFLKSRLPANPRLLELGCGGGSNAFYLKPLFSATTLTDISSRMLAESKRINPECEHIRADMRTFRLNRTFDAVLAHDAIGYMTSEADLRAVFTTAIVHLEPGGVALFVPDFVKETFQSATSHGGSDAESRGLRYLEWVYDPDESDRTYEMAFAYMLREGKDRPKVKHEVHELGLFAAAEWMRWLKEAGFEPEALKDQYDREIFFARKPKD